MKKFSIEPHVGIGPIKLGAERQSVRAALAEAGFPLEDTSASGRVDYFCNASIQIEFDASDCADWIGLSFDKAYELSYEGINVFDVPAAEIFRVIGERDNSGAHEFQEAEYLFPGQIVTLYDADPQYDRLRPEERVIWAQVGIGNQQYLEAVRAIETRRAAK
jgi:hypothetical protein